MGGQQATPCPLETLMDKGLQKIANPIVARFVEQFVDQRTDSTGRLLLRFFTLSLRLVGYLKGNFCSSLPPRLIKRKQLRDRIHYLRQDAW